MEIREINNKEIWEEFLLKCKEKTFLQSWNWGEFNERLGKKFWRLGIYENNNLIATALVVKVTAKRGTYLNVPHGPVSLRGSLAVKTEIIKDLLVKLKEIGTGEGIDFIRISPIWERNEANEKAFKENKFKTALMHEHAESSWKLDITLSEDELTKGMRKTTRYLIRQAQKRPEIKIFQSNKVEDVETFNNLYQEVVKIQHFIPFSLDYLKHEFSAFSKDNQIILFFGEYDEELAASAFVIFYSGIGFYHHAALSPKYHKVPIAYLLQWEAIKEAKKRGCQLYDFWGYIDPKEEPKHPWAGPTLFKMGFGGNGYKYLKTQDFPLTNKYWLTYIFEKLRKAKRGL